MTLKRLRKEKGLTQIECAKYLQIPHRTYCRYESDESKINPIKYQYILDKLNNYGFIDEEHGVLTLEQIKKSCAEVFSEYGIEYCYLFGSYAKGKAKETSDVDLLVATTASGMEFFGLVEALRETLRKRVDVLDVAQLNNNPTLVREILKDGVKIYG